MGAFVSGGACWLVGVAACLLVGGCTNSGDSSSTQGTATTTGGGATSLASTATTPASATTPTSSAVTSATGSEATSSGGQGTSTTGSEGSGAQGQGGSGAVSGAGGSSLEESTTASGGSSPGGAGGGTGGLGVWAEGWGTVRCFMADDDYECFAQLPDATVVSVYPACSMQSIGQSPGFETLGTDPREHHCATPSTPEDLQRWDQMQCWRATDTLCMASSGDWAIWIHPDCDPDDGDYIPDDDPDFLECPYDTEVWEDVRCRYLDHWEEDTWCEGKWGSYWSRVRCRITWGPESEVDPSTVPCLMFDSP